MGWIGLLAVVAFPMVAFMTVGDWDNLGPYRWVWGAACVALALTALIFLPVTGGDCHVDWDGRGNPIECE